MLTVVAFTVVVVPFTVKLPEIATLSARVVVPPAESIVRLPDDVVSVFPSSDKLSTAAAPETVSVPVNVSLASDRKKDAELIPSRVSASSPDPAPSTVLMSVSISLAV